MKYWVEGYCTRKNLCVEIAPNDENTPLDYSLCALRHALMRSFSSRPLLPTPRGLTVFRGIDILFSDLSGILFSLLMNYKTQKKHKSD